jgi:hypothetical protein
MSVGHNKPPVELSREEAAFVRDILDRDLGQSLMVLEMVQAGKLPREAAESAVAYTEKARPIFKKIKEALQA